jgi:hypothetical protein
VFCFGDGILDVVVRTEREHELIIDTLAKARAAVSPRLLAQDCITLEFL